MVNKIERFFLILIAILLFSACTDKTKNYNYNKDKELKQLYKIVNKVHKSIRYGTGRKDALFTDEILKYGEGHCGHISRVLFRELTKKGYQPEIISINTYNKRSHSMIQIKTKYGSKILLDATTNIIYTKSVNEIVDKPSLVEKNTIGKSKFIQFSNTDFWKSVRNIQFLPYLDAYIIKDITNKDKIVNLIDFRYLTLFKIGEKIKIKFSKLHRLSSIVIYPLNSNIQKRAIEVFCYDKKNIKNSIYKSDLIDQRSLFTINLSGNDYCKELELDFSKSIRVRDIYIYGK